MEKDLLKAIEHLLDKKFDEKLEPIKVTLGEHGAILNEHSIILNEHSAILGKHSTMLESHDEQLITHNSMLKEQYAILKALEHSAEVNTAERDKMQHDIAHIKGDVESIRKDMSRIEEATAYNWADIAKLKAAQ